MAALISEMGRGEAVAAFDPSIGLGLALLDVNDRLDAIAFECVQGGSTLLHLRVRRVTRIGARNQRRNEFTRIQRAAEGHLRAQCIREVVG